jgi:MFS family permease
METTMMEPPSSTLAPEWIRQARGRFACMAGAYFLGTFNDNLFKQAVLVLAVATIGTAMQGYALVAFTLPFLCFAAPAGWCADRFPKGRVVVAAKWMELGAVLCGAVGIGTGHWSLMFVMLFIMGAQATLFSPALNGSLPELYPEAYLTRANGILRLLVTLAILAGVALAGILLDRPGEGWGGIARGRLLVAGTLIAVALLGVAVSYGVPHRPAANPGARFPWAGPVRTLGDLLETRGDPVLALTIIANVFIWLMGSLELLIINPLGLQQFHLSKTLTSALIVSQLAGMAAGGVVISRRVHLGGWYRLIGPLGGAMGGVMLGFLAVPALLPAAWRVPSLFALTFLVGVLAGGILIPMESFLQVRPPAARKGAVLSSVNFVVFGGILLSGLISNVLNARWAPTTAFGILGGGCLVVSLALHAAFRRVGVRANGGRRRPEEARCST